MVAIGRVVRLIFMKISPSDEKYFLCENLLILEYFCRNVCLYNFYFFWNGASIPRRTDRLSEPYCFLSRANRNQFERFCAISITHEDELGLYACDAKQYKCNSQSHHAAYPINRWIFESIRESRKILSTYINITNFNCYGILFLWNSPNEFRNLEKKNYIIVSSNGTIKF